VNYSKIAALLAFAAAGALPLAAAQAGVGVTSMIDGSPTGQRQSGSERILRVGRDIQQNERVVTKTDDRAHLVFLDGTSITLGPDSELVIDKFAYDPDKKSGDLELTVTRGTFRFVGGAISKQNEVLINTPSGVLGISGGIATATVTPAGMVANFLYGTSLRAFNPGGIQTATRAGSQITIPSGGVPSAATVIGPGALPGNAALEHQGPPIERQRVPVALRRNAAQLNQMLTQPGASDDSSDPTPTAASPGANDTSNTQIGSGDDAVRNSILSKHNSGLSPAEARLPITVARQEASLARSSKAAAPPGSAAPKVPAGLASPHGNPAQKATATHFAAVAKTTAAQSTTTKR
jgi:hypothetical protein